MLPTLVKVPYYNAAECISEALSSKFSMKKNPNNAAVNCSIVWILYSLNSYAQSLKLVSWLIRLPCTDDRRASNRVIIDIRCFCIAERVAVTAVNDNRVLHLLFEYS
jgi:hypothetical protein